MESFDVRLITYAIWGVGTTLVYFVVLVRRVRTFEKRRDARARRELLAGFGLFLTAAAANIAVLSVLFGREDGDNLHSFFSALALGAYFAVGLMMAIENGSDHDDR